MVGRLVTLRHLDIFTSLLSNIANIISLFHDTSLPSTPQALNISRGIHTHLSVKIKPLEVTMNHVVNPDTVNQEGDVPLLSANLHVMPWVVVQERPHREGAPYFRTCFVHVKYIRLKVQASNSLQYTLTVFLTGHWFHNAWTGFLSSTWIHSEQWFQRKYSQQKKSGKYIYIHPLYIRVPLKQWTVGYGWCKRDCSQKLYYEW